MQTLIIDVEDSYLEQIINFLQQIPKNKREIFYHKKIDILNFKNKQKSAYELGKNLFGRYSSGKTNLSTTYKNRLKDKIYAKNSH